MFELKMAKQELVNDRWKQGEIINLYYYTLEEAAIHAQELMEDNHTFISITYIED